MSEPPEIATAAEPVAPGIWRCFHDGGWGSGEWRASMRRGRDDANIGNIGEERTRLMRQRDATGRALRTPGPEPVHYCLLAEGRDALVCSDLLMRGEQGGLGYVPLEYHDDPAATRASVAGLLDHDFTLLLLDHGPPVPDGKAAIRTLLAEDTATA